MRFALIIALAAAVVLTVSLPAQAPSPWSVQPATGGTVSRLGKLVVHYQPTAGRVAVYSAFTREWANLENVGGNAVIRKANDWCLVQAGAQWHAFSAYRGVWCSRTLGVGASIVNPSSQRNDSIVLVQDGATLAAFSGFTGTWVDRTLGSGANRIAVQRHAAIVADGDSLHGLNAWEPVWRRVPFSGLIQGFDVDGTAATVTTPDGIWGFAAQTATWSRHRALPGATRHAAGDTVVFEGNGKVLGFSGLTGTFAETITVPGVTPNLDRQLAIVVLGTRTLLYSAVTGSWTAWDTNTTPTTQLAGVTALLVEADRVHGFSALRSSVATLVQTPATNPRLARAVAAVEDPLGDWHLYSAMTGSWTSPMTLRSAPVLSAGGALVTTGSGYAAYRAEDGSLMPLAMPTTPAAVPHVDGSSAVIAVTDVDVAHAFDGRVGRWVTTPLPGSAPAVTAQWRTTFVAVRGQNAVGYGAQAGAWHGTTLPSPMQNLGASSEVVAVEGAGYLAVFGGLPEVLGQWQFPAFRRVQTVGAPLRVHVRVSPGTTLRGLAVGPWAPQPMPVPDLGDLLLDSGSIVIPITAERSGPGYRVELGTPRNPSLRGTRWVLQGLMLGDGRRWLTEGAGLQLW